MRVLGEREKFAQGDVACAYGALLGGCNFFAGYPITPATEVAEAMARLVPRIGGTIIQMEDEIASLSAVIGASWAGSRAMTATSGPGFSLMQENIGYACMTEAPCVIVNVQRSGPSTGQPTEPAQGDMMQARWGTHGDHEIIALAPASVQECVDLTRDAFDLADEYRNPVLVMTDGEVGHMRESIRLPAADELEIRPRGKPTTSAEEHVPFLAVKGGQIPEMADFGTGYHTYVTGLTHDERGMPSTDDAESHSRLVRRLCDKISSNVDRLTRVEEHREDGARVGVGPGGDSDASEGWREDQSSASDHRFPVSGEDRAGVRRGTRPDHRARAQPGPNLPRSTRGHRRFGEGRAGAKDRGRDPDARGDHTSSYGRRRTVMNSGSGSGSGT